MLVWRVSVTPACWRICARGWLHARGGENNAHRRHETRGRRPDTNYCTIHEAYAHHNEQERTKGTRVPGNGAREMA